jgi:hypothetical protein
MPLLARLRTEAARVALATLYFFVAFSIIGTMKMLYLAEYAIETAALAKATLGALVVGKVVVVLGATSIGQRFRKRMVAIDIAYRSLLYTVAVAAVVVVERLVHGYLDTGTWSAGWQQAVQAANLMRLVANVIGVYLSFIGYNVLATFAAHFGRGRLLAFLFTREGAAQPAMADEPVLRDPAAGG